MDRESLTREVRRRQVTEALEFERSRAELLRDQMEALVAERDGPGLDERIFEGMTPEEIAVVKPALQAPEDEIFAFEDEAEEGEAEDPAAVDEHAAYQEGEIERLAGEIDSSRVRQRAFERYLELLGR